MPKEEIISQARLYDGRLISLRVDTVRLANGKEARREIIEHADVAAIVALDEQGRVALVRQYRRAVGQEMLEIPAGLMNEGETPEQAALRELSEETGKGAQRWRRLGGFYTSPGFCNEFVHIFLARGLSALPGTPDEDEDLALSWLPLPEALRLVSSGDICDGKSVAGLLLAAQDPEC